MPHTKQDPPQNWWFVMLRDPHWWAPVIVLIAGLVILQWIR
jgi:hypothetical protein